MTALEVRGLEKRFGGVTALAGVDLEAGGGQVAAVIGPNGAGKTTLFDCLTGRTRPDAGRVHLGGRDLTDLDPVARTRAGLGRTFQRLEVFAGMTVAENLLVAAEARRPWSPRSLLVASTDGPAQQRVDDVLSRLHLEHLAGAQVGDLPTGTLRLVEVGRALCTEPSVLLLDEPASGLDDRELATLRTVVREVAARGVAVVLVEHDVALVLDVSDVVHVLDGGRVVASGTPADVVADAAARAAYLDTAPPA